MNPIVILGPMHSETDYLIEQLGNLREVSIGEYRFFCGELEGRPLVIGRTQIGMVNAAAAATAAILRFEPECILLQGTSGAHDPSLHRGDIVLGKTLVNINNYMIPHRDKGAGSRPDDWEFFGTEMTVNGSLTQIKRLFSDETLLRIAESVPYAKGNKVTGSIGSGDVWNRELDRISAIQAEYGTFCEEMECFAVAQVCDQLGKIPLLVIRIISNNEWHAEETFDPSVGTDCQKFTLDVVREYGKQA